MSRTRRERRGERGAVMVETALIAGTILTLLLFSIQVGLLGFLQLTADAASFVNSRETALGFTTTATSSIFPQIGPGNIGAPQTLPAPQPSVPVDYGYNSTNATRLANSAFNRNGGSSMMEPVLTLTTVSKPGIFHKFGFLLGVTGADTEAKWQECGIHSNIANDGSPCGDASDTNQNTYGTFSGNYFTKGENTPPYFASFNYIQHCLTPQPWSGSVCGPASQDFIGLGVAEYLTGSQAPTVANWSALQNGVSGAAGTSAFQAAACHQRVFAAIAAFFALYPNLTTMYAVNGSGVVCQLYKSCQLGGTQTGFNDFSLWGVGTPIPVFGTTIDADIQQIYSWDHRVAGGYPTSGAALPTQYPLNPENGC